MKNYLTALSHLIPILQWLPRYQREWLWRDISAGITLAAYAVPVAMAYATLAGLPPQTGIYSYIFGGIAFALFTSSRHLSVGPTASISVMVAGAIGAMNYTDPQHYAAIAALTAVLTSLFCLLAWVMKLSAFVSFISESILLGFKAGAAVSIACMQLPKLLGVPGGGDNMVQRLFIITQQLHSANLTVVSLGLGSLLIIFAGSRLLPGKPVALAVMAVATGLVSLYGLGADVAGQLPVGLPQLTLPRIQTDHLDSLLEVAFACFLLSYVESIAAARAFAAKHHYSIDSRQELLGLGAANLAAALGGGYPVAGGLSQSAVNERAGAHTPLSLLIASAVLSTLLCFLTGMLNNLPLCVLAAIVLVAVAGFVQLDDFKRLREVSRIEFNVALVAFGGVIMFGILKGVAISAIVSILFLLRMMSKPHLAILGRIPGSTRFSDALRHTSNERFPGLLLFRIEAPLLYFNVDTVNARVLEAIDNERSAVKLAVFDLSTSPFIDTAGATMLQLLEQELELRGIQLRVAEAHAEVRDILRSTGISERLGGVSRYTALADIVEEFERDCQRAATRPADVK